MIDKARRKKLERAAREVRARIGTQRRSPRLAQGRGTRASATSLSRAALREFRSWAESRGWDAAEMALGKRMRLWGRVYVPTQRDLNPANSAVIARVNALTGEYVDPKTGAVLSQRQIEYRVARAQLTRRIATWARHLGVRDADARKFLAALDEWRTAGLDPQALLGDVVDLSGHWTTPTPGLSPNRLPGVKKKAPKKKVPKKARRRESADTIKRRRAALLGIARKRARRGPDGRFISAARAAKRVGGIFRGLLARRSRRA